MSLLPISPYVAWKGLATNSAIPANSRPDLNSSGPPFKPRPINHWRKQLIPNQSSGGRNRRAGVGMPMDTPSGAVYLGDVIENTTCLLNATDDVVGLKENLVKYNIINFENGCGPCNPEKNRIKSSTTILSKRYYSDRKAYLRSRGSLYDQKLTALPLDLVDSNETNSTRKIQNCVGLENTSCNTIYKPNNSQYAKQGAVDSSDRLTRLKLNTINKNAASYKTIFNTTAPRYTGAASTPYFLKSKYQACVPLHRTGHKTIGTCEKYEL